MPVAISSPTICPTPAGTVRIDGQETTGTTPSHVGYLFQEDTVLPWYTVRHNIALGLRYRGRPKREIAASVNVAQLLVRERLGQAGAANRVVDLAGELLDP